jgi:tetratricopeptide (TPR) repeat protein
VKEEGHRAENKQAADPSQFVAGRTWREARWRTVALTAAAIVVLAALLTGGALWWRHRRAALREEVTTALTEAIRLRDAGQFQESRKLLEDTLTRLGASGPGDLVDQASMALADTRLVERLDTARQRLFDNSDAGNPLDFAETEREYATTLNEAVLVREGEDKDVIAARVRNSSVRTALLAAIQDWAAVTTDEPRRAWLLAVACAADPDPERDRLRRPELWQDRAALARVAGEPVPKSLSPELAVALARRAISANVPGPMPLLVEVQKRYPRDFWLNVTTGLTLHHHQKWEEAIGCHRAAMATRPRVAVVYYNLGMTLRGQQKVDESLEQFEEALRLDPKFANAHNGAGLSLYEKRKPNEAKEHYKEALRLNPNHVNVLVNLGVLLTEKKLLDEAINNFEAALRIKPRNASAHYHYGNALREKNETDRAIGKYQEAVNIFPRYAAAHNALGNAFHAKNQMDQAIHHYEQAIQIEPANATYHANLGNSLRLGRRLDEAITRFREALVLNPKYASAQNGMGNTLSDKGDPDGAIPYYEEAIRLAPKNAGFHVNLGKALWDLGRHEAAIRQYKEALQIDPKNSTAQNSLGSSYLGMGKVDQAIVCFERAIRLDAKNSSAHSNLGIIRLYGHGDTAEASVRFKRAGEIHPNDAVIEFNVGQALLVEGRFAKAWEAVSRALDFSATDQRYREVFLQTMRQLEDVNRLSAMEARLPAILQKKQKPADAAETLRFAWLCQVKLRFAAAARLYADSFAADPKPANELSAGYRLNAARCAALAAAGWGLDSPKPSDAERAGLRGQTLKWLRADLTAWQKQIVLANQEARSAARRTLTLWLSDFRFFAVREKEELMKLQDKERAGWEKLWADTEALRIETRAGRAGERWADPGLRVVEGLELWLSAAELNAARQVGGLAPLKAGDEVETWFDSSGKGRHVGQAVQAARPRLVRVGQDWLVRFDGHSLLEAPGSVPPAGSLFVVYRNGNGAGGGQRLLGWEDSDVGNHGLGLMPEAGGRLLAILRNEGQNGDLVDARRSSGFEIVSLRWGPGGVTLHRNGTPAGANKNLTRISSDPLIRSLHLGGPGSGGAPRFRGDIAEVLIYNRVLSADETEAVRQYLDRKYARLREALPAALSVK